MSSKGNAILGLLFLASATFGETNSPPVTGTLPSPPEIKWSCLDSNAQVSLDVLPQATNCTIRVHERIGSTEVSIVPMVARPTCDAGIGREEYYYIGPFMAAVPSAKELFTVFHVFCGYGEVPRFEWHASTLYLDDGRLLHALTNHPFIAFNSEAGSHINHVLVFPELPDATTNVTLKLPYSLHSTATELKYQFKREHKGSQPSVGSDGTPSPKP